jgi:hypothetical protein
MAVSLSTHWHLSCISQERETLDRSQAKGIYLQRELPATIWKAALARREVSAGRVRKEDAAS